MIVYLLIPQLLVKFEEYYELLATKRMSKTQLEYQMDAKLVIPVNYFQLSLECLHHLKSISSVDEKQ